MLEFLTRHFWRIWISIYGAAAMGLAYLSLAHFFGWWPA